MGTDFRYGATGNALSCRHFHLAGPTELERPVHNSVTENEFPTKQRLAAELQTHGLFANYGLSCEYCEGVVVLRGRVQSFHEKQLAQELVRRMDGVKIVVNRLVVDRSKFTRDVTEEIPLKADV